MIRQFLSCIARTATALAIIVGLTACAANDELIVFAAASLEGHLPDYADETVSFAGSNSLVAQILDGAPAGVLITANQSVAEPVINELGPEVMALVANRITVVVPADNPGVIDSLDDLADPDRTIAVCAPEVPCGQATAALDVVIEADTFEPNVRSVLTKVELDEVDAGLVYSTDVASSTNTIELDLLGDPPVVIYTALLLDPGNAAAVEYFDWLAGAGRDALLAAGFEAP